jgi:hypothetical protein
MILQHIYFSQHHKEIIMSMRFKSLLFAIMVLLSYNLVTSVSAETMTQMLKQLEQNSKKVKGDINTLKDLMKNRKSPEEVEKSLKATIEMVDSMLAMVDSKSEFAALSQKYIDGLAADEQHNRNKFATTGNYKYNNFADRYKKLLKEAKEYRQEIFKGRIANGKKLRELEAMKDLIVEEIRLEGAEEINKGFVTVLNGLIGTLNHMDNMIDMAGNPKKQPTSVPD